MLKDLYMNSFDVYKPGPYQKMKPHLYTCHTLESTPPLSPATTSVTDYRFCGYKWTAELMIDIPNLPFALIHPAQKAGTPYHTLGSTPHLALTTTSDRQPILPLMAIALIIGMVDFVIFP